MISRFVSLPPPDRRLAMRALGIVIWVRLRLTFDSFPAVDRITKQQSVRATVGRHSPSHLGSAVAGVSRYVPGATCLTQALAARVLLADEGHSSTLRIGMARIDGSLRAHAWLVSGETIVVGAAGHRQFAPFEGVVPSPNA